MATKQTLPQQANALVTLFIDTYKAKFGMRPEKINRYRDRWGFQAMIEDLGYDRSKEVIAFYMETNRPIHDVSGLLNNYDRINTIMKDKAEDEAARQRLREESRIRVELWRQQNSGN